MMDIVKIRDKLRVTIQNKVYITENNEFRIKDVNLTDTEALEFTFGMDDESANNFFKYCTKHYDMVTQHYEHNNGYTVIINKESSINFLIETLSQSTMTKQVEAVTLA